MTDENEYELQPEPEKQDEQKPEIKPEEEKQNDLQPPAPETGGGENLEEVKIFAALAYIVFFLPLLVKPESGYGKFHANQGLLLLITSIIVSIVSLVPIIGLFLALLGWVFVVVLFIMGILNAVNGKQERLPLIGNFDIIKQITNEQ